jgi:hypothetical protein
VPKTIIFNYQYVTRYKSPITGVITRVQDPGHQPRYFVTSLATSTVQSTITRTVQSTITSNISGEEGREAVAYALRRTVKG